MKADGLHFGFGIPIDPLTSRRFLCKSIGYGKATLYLDDGIHKALRMKAAETSRSMSDLVNDALEAILLEDLEDIEAWQKRRNDQGVGFEDFVRQLKEDGVIQG